MSWLENLKNSLRARPRYHSILEFRDAVMAAIHAGNPAIEQIAEDERTIALSLPGQDLGRMFMDNTYDSYRDDDPDRFDFYVGRLAATALESGQDFRAVDRLVLVARNLALLSDPPCDVISRPLAGDLIFVLAFNSAASLRYATAADLEHLVLTREAAMDAALAGLRNRIGPLARHDEPGSPLHAILAESSLATGALAIPDIWCEREDRRAVFVDTKASFFWTDADDPEGMMMLRQYATRRQEQYDTVSKMLIVFDHGRWIGG